MPKLNKESAMVSENRRGALRVLGMYKALKTNMESAITTLNKPGINKPFLKKVISAYCLSEMYRFFRDEPVFDKGYHEALSMLLTKIEAGDSALKDFANTNIGRKTIEIVANNSNAILADCEQIMKTATLFSVTARNMMKESF